MKKMTESRLLRKIRRYSLWAFLASSLGVLLLSILEAWEVISTYDEARGRGRGGGSGMNEWGKIEATLSIIMAISLIVLVAILVSSRTKKDKDDCCKDCCCKDCCTDDCCKDDAPASKAAPVAMAAPKVVAKSAAPKKAAPKK